MNTEIPDLETELMRMRPAQPSPELMKRIARQLDTPAKVAAPRMPAPGLLLQWILPPTVAVAAGLALILAPWVVHHPAPEAPTQDTPAYTPVLAKSLVYERQDAGLVTLSDGTTARRVLERAVDVFEWRNPSTQATFSWSVPREELRLVRLSML
jgi:hypothetical protein